MPSRPYVQTLPLSRVTSVPDFHPEAIGFAGFDVFGFVIHHGDGPIVVDTGIGLDNEFINQLYGHQSVSIIDALHDCHVDERDVQCIINSHLHFDHCGQNHALGAPIVAQRAEVEAAAGQFYTVPQWADIPVARSSIVDGDVEIATGVHVLLTPGHTPGHQAVSVATSDGLVLIAAQCIYRADAWTGGVEANNLHDDSWREVAAESLARLRALRPATVLLSHDTSIELGQ
jgi:N-acyl homoserine lactone hydrolase